MSEALVMSGSFRRLRTSEQAIVVDTDPCTEEVRYAERARRQAREEAERACRENLEKEQRRYAALWRTLETSFDGLVVDMQKQIREQLVGMSLRLAEIIVRSRLPDRDMIQQLMIEVLEPVSDLQGATIRVCPADAEWLRTLPAGTGRMASIQVVADAALTPGDLMVESRNGYFDGRLSERLEVLKERLHERAEGQHASRQPA